VDYPQFPLTQTEAVTVPAAPVMQSAVVTAGSIVITYNVPTTCATASADFVYDSTTGTSGGAIASCSGVNTVTLLPTTTFTLPVGTTATLVYTAPATNSAAASVYATGTTVYAATQTLALTGIPAMVSAVVTNTAITVTYGQAVSCPTTFVNDWTYYSVTLPGDQLGGVVTGCTASGDVLTLTATGGFNAPQGTAELVYAAPAPNGPPVTNSVFATGTTVLAASQILPGSAITA
jgi:hypothetical protein